MNKYIVTTTINKPNIAMHMYNQMDGWELIVAADKKTPCESFDGFDVLTPEYQESKWGKLSGLVGWNCIQRRNFAFLEALERGAEVIATVDDDNYPLPNWGYGGGNVEACVYYDGCGVFDPLYPVDKNLWHRGFPVEYLEKRSCRYEIKENKYDVLASLWLGDPDVDSVCRRDNMTTLITDRMFEYASDEISPFNSQNTALTREALKNYFMFPHVGRMDDIYGSYNLESMGYKVRYAEPTVYHIRTGHTIENDYMAEEHGRRNLLPIVERILEGKEWMDLIPMESRMAWDEYIRITGDFK